MLVVGINEILARTGSDYRFWFVDNGGQSAIITWASIKEKDTLEQLRPISLDDTHPYGGLRSESSWVSYFWTRYRLHSIIDTDSDACYAVVTEQG